MKVKTLKSIEPLKTEKISNGNNFRITTCFLFNIKKYLNSCESLYDIVRIMF